MRQFTILFVLGVIARLLLTALTCCFSKKSQKKYRYDAAKRALPSANIDGLRFGFLPASESTPQDFPVVVENCKPNLEMEDFLVLLNENSDFFKDIVGKYGAILFRGFPVNSTKDFERVACSLPWMVPVDDFEFLRRGQKRELIDGCKYCYNTASDYRTGGGVRLPQFHVESMFRPYIPKYFMFWSKRQSHWGGGTGLIDLRSVLNELSPSTLDRLERAKTVIPPFSIRKIASEYSLSESVVREKFTELGFTVTGDDIQLYRPLITEVEGEKLLTINFHLVGKHFQSIMQSMIVNDYIGIEWILHRIVWFLNLTDFVVLFDNVLNYKTPWKRVVKEISREIGEGVQELGGMTDRFANLDDHDMISIASSCRKHFAAVEWKTGDFLLADNRLVAHDGLPGSYDDRECASLWGNWQTIKQFSDRPPKWEDVPTGIATVFQQLTKSQ